MNEYDSLQDTLSTPPPNKRKNIGVAALGFALEIAQIVIVVLVLSFIFRMFVFQPFYIFGSSMEPSYHEGEMLLVDEITYRFRSPMRGEVVVLQPPNDVRDFIKRIIALPGETIAINEYGQVLINGEVLQEPYLNPENQFTRGRLEMTLGDDEYFVMGDNRTVSNDSRGIINPLTDEAIRPWTVSRKNIIGRSLIRWFPLNKLDIIKRPAYEEASSSGL